MAFEKIPLAAAAREAHSDPSVYRRVLNRFGLTDRQQDGQRVVDARVAMFMKRTKAASGYLVPYWIKTRDDLMAAAAKIPVAEIELTEASSEIELAEAP